MIEIDKTEIQKRSYADKIVSDITCAGNKKAA